MSVKTLSVQTRGTFLVFAETAADILGNFCGGFPAFFCFFNPCAFCIPQSAQHEDENPPAAAKNHG